MKLIDLTGQRFGRLVVLERDTSRTGDTFWKCRCDCGNVKSVCASYLRSGTTQSCGCLRYESATTHGLSGTKAYCKRQELRDAYDALMSCYPLTLENLDGEQWADVAGYEGHYQVSTFGRVKSFKYKTPRIVKPQPTDFGYLKVSLWIYSKQKIFSVHRLVATAFILNSDGKREVNHIDGHRLNNHVSNFEWVTHAENSQHAVDTGLQKRGEERSDAVLTNAQVVYVREVYIPNDREFGASALARKLGVNRNVIHRAVRGETYLNAGGNIHDKIDLRIPDEIRKQICAEYKRGIRGFGCEALAEKYGVGASTIWRIINERK